MRVVAMIGVATLLQAGCLQHTPEAYHTSFGLPTAGYMTLSGTRLDDLGEGYVRKRPEDNARYGREYLLDALVRAAAMVSRAYPEGSPVLIGDISLPFGGRYPGHLSHRSGRDADVGFYVKGAKASQPLRRSWVRFDEMGWAEDDGRRLEFDDARNWLFVRTLLADPKVDVQWIFCAQGLKERLLRYALKHEPSEEIIALATWVVHEPSFNRNHDDHFHIRVTCSAADRQLGCRDAAPDWYWNHDITGKYSAHRETLLDDVVLSRWVARDLSN